ncbi:MAG: PAS domain S-box protein, partial [Candidatus Sulfotelmatobacter sp.]
MGDRVTRVPQSRELVRAKRLRQALERGAPPAFVPPAVPNPAAQPFSLSWSSGEKSTGENGSAEKTPAEKASAENPRTKTNSRERNSKKTSSEETNSRRQYLEQLFQNSPDPLVITDRSFRAQCVNHEFQRLFGYSPAQILGKSINQLIFPP